MRAPWASTAAMIDLAERLPGHGAADVGAWMATQMSRVDDPAFAGRFAAVAEITGRPVAEFSHRIVRAGDLTLLGGVRFFGRDPDRPFVELLAWDGPAGPSPEAWAAIRGAVAEAWSAVAPRAVRLFHAPGLALPADAMTDMTVHAATHAAMAGAAPALGIAPLTDARRAAALVRARYEALRGEDAALARDLAPASDEARAEAAAAGGVLGIWLDDALVGLLAVGAGSVKWLRGDVVLEEVVLPHASGRGLAAVAQREWARSRAAEAPGRLLLGTILARNQASRRTALRAGRPEVARLSFLPLAAPRL